MLQKRNCYGPKFLLLKQAFHAATENFRNAIQGIGACLVDVLVSLLIHLDRAERNTGVLCKLGLCAAVGVADVLQVGFLEMCAYLFHPRYPQISGSSRKAVGFA